MSSNRRQDIIAALLFIATAALIIWVAIPMGVQVPKKVKFAALNPAYYPRLVGYCLMAFGGLLLLRHGLKKGQAKNNTEQTHTEPNQTEPNQTEQGRYRPNAVVVMLLTAIILFAWYWFLSSLGFVLTSIVALVFMQLIAGERNPLAITLIALLVPCLLYLFFTKVANIPIPGGILDPWLIRI